MNFNQAAKEQNSIFPDFEAVQQTQRQRSFPASIERQFLKLANFELSMSIKIADGSCPVMECSKVLYGVWCNTIMKKDITRVDTLITEKLSNIWNSDSGQREKR